MKKNLMLIIMVVFICAFNVCLSEFDVNVFKDPEKYQLYDYDDFEDMLYVMIEKEPMAMNNIITPWGRREDETYMPFWDCMTCICPEVVVGNVSKASILPIMRISISYVDSDWIFMDNVQFKVDDKIYTFPIDNDKVSRTVSMYGGYCEEKTVIIIDKQNVEFIDAIVGSKEEIKIRLSGRNGSKDYSASQYKDKGTMEERRKDHFKNGVITIYEDFLSAGGKEYLDKFQGSNMTVK